MVPFSDDPNDITRSYMPFAKDAIVGHYRIIEKIGAGGMGEAYLAEDLQLGRKVVLKFLQLHLCRDADLLARFEREAQAAAKLSHPNIITIYEVNEFNDRPYFAMEYIEGDSLSDLIKKCDYSIEEILDLAVQICEGLRKAHQTGIIHRDIKPSNIHIDRDGRARILDFGLAAIKGTDQLTKTGSVFGTPRYMSPEQARGEPLDERSDIFSYGAVLYEMITGQASFKGENDTAVIHSIEYKEPEPMARYKSGVPDELQRIVNKALTKDRNLRYQHADDLCADLKGIRRQPEFLILTKQPSIAVLPFINMSPDPEQEYFCDGMAEEIINALSHLGNLRVISRTSAFSFKGKAEDVRDIGRKLGVETLLEGSVRKAGNRLRITAQLVAAKDGSHLWSGRYDREMKEVFAIQDEICLAIVDELKISLIEGERAKLARVRDHDIEAYNLYLQGLYYYRKWALKDFMRAILYFERAIERDPDLAIAYSGLANCYSMLNLIWVLSPTEAYTKGKALALKAIEKDRLLGEAHCSLAWITWVYDWDWPNAEKRFKQAIELNPGYATSYDWYAMYLMNIGQTAPSLDAIAKAEMLDPLSPIIKAVSAMMHCVLGHFAEAEEQCRKILAMNPNFYYAHTCLGHLHELRGMHDDAIRQYRLSDLGFGTFSSHDFELLDAAYKESGWPAYWRKHAELLKKHAGDRYISAMSIAYDYVRLNDPGRTLEWLEKALEQRDFRPEFYLSVNPVFAPLKSDPRIAALLKKMGLEGL